MRKNIIKSSSQVTIFLILGIICLLGMGVYFALKKYTEPKFRILPIDNVPATNQNKNNIFKNDVNLTRLQVKEWFWVETVLNSSVGIRPGNLTSFKISFKQDFTFSSTTDCNNISGEYEVFEDRIKLKNIVRTQMYCMKSKETEYLEGLGNVFEISFNEKNELILKYKDSTNFMRFK